MPVARVSPASYTGDLPHSSVSVRQARAQLAAALYERDDRIAAEHGFTDVAHTLEIFGTCAQCAHR